MALLVGVVICSTRPNWLISSGHDSCWHGTATLPVWKYVPVIQSTRVAGLSLVVVASWMSEALLTIKNRILPLSRHNESYQTIDIVTNNG